MSDANKLPSPDFFRALELERTQALVAQDVPAIRRLHAPDYELITVPGRVMSLERYLSLMAEEVFYASWNHGPMRVRVTAGMAAVRYQARIRFPCRAGKCFAGIPTSTSATKQPSRGWRATWSQATPLPPDAELQV